MTSGLTFASWGPCADLEDLTRRAESLAMIRQFFKNRSVLEVETPILCQAVDPDPQIECFNSHYSGPGCAEPLTMFLRSSPEFHMKRLLCAGSGSIYQIAKVFRQGELGDLHQPEFTLLEWYRLDFDHLDLIAEIDQLLLALDIKILGLANSQIKSYQEIFRQVLNLDPLSCDRSDLLDCMHDHHINLHDTQIEEPSFYLDCLMSHVVQPQLGLDAPLFLTDFPAPQAALARINPDDSRLSQRFELFIKGVEIANGFCELRDVLELEQRLEADIQTRARRGQTQVPLDKKLLAAQRQGLPPCAGVALGLDRLFMLLSGQKNIKNVMSFSEYPVY